MQDTVDGHAALSSLRQAPADLLVVVLAVLFTMLTTLSALEGTVFETVVRAAFVGFVPGYALVVSLFPGTSGTSRVPERDSAGGLTRFERIALSIAASGSLLAIVAGGLSVLSADSGRSAIWVLCGLTAGFVAVAAVRRLSLPPSKRLGRPATVWLTVFNPFPLPRSGRGLLSTAAIGLVVLFVLSSAVYALAPLDGDGYTELYLLHEDDGELSSEDYPTDLTVGEDQPLIVGIGNNEGTETTYTLVVQLQNVSTDTDGTTVESSTELDRFEVTLQDGETVEDEHVVTPDRSGENLRLVYLLYVGGPPESPAEENAYRSAYIWIDVDETE